ncbi:MAG: Hsp70 family protein [Mycobacteriaceae bacterium]|nr:Hsp70 family protein [Mycobacteriaceae bacterium]
MSDSLGLSIGMTNLVAARMGRPPVMRRSVLTLFEDRAAEVGVPSEYSGDPSIRPSGMVLTGFVERVGDPVPLVAADGSAHRGEQVLVEALDAMARTVGGGAPIAIAVPAHWGAATVGALRGALRATPSLAPNGVAPALVPDSVAALSALQAAPGLPSSGVVVLCDFGGSGTSVTLADAGANYDTIGETVRYADFSGDQIDQALLNHVVAGIAEASDADPANTAAVGSLAKLRNDCRLAKERLSAETAAAVHAELPGFASDVRVTRTELEQLIAAPLTGFLHTVEEALQRNNIAAADVSAVATVGGGANIPLVTQQLSTRLRAPVVTTPQSQVNVAAGAAVLAEGADAATGMATAADAPTGMAPTAGWVAGAAGAGAAGAAAAGMAGDATDSSTFRALAWSQDDIPAGGGEPVPYTGDDYTFDPAATGSAARPPMEFSHEEEGFTPEPGPLPWYKRPTILFGAAAAAVLLAIGGLAVTLTGTSSNTGPVTETATTFETGPSPAGPPTSQTITVTGSDGQPSTTVVPPPSTTTTTTTAPSTTSSTTTTTTTTTTTQPTTTQPTTTQPTTTQPTTTQPPTTTEDPIITTTVVVPDVVVPDDGT